MKIKGKCEKLNTKRIIEKPVTRHSGNDTVFSYSVAPADGVTAQTTPIPITESAPSVQLTCEDVDPHRRSWTETAAASTFPPRRKRRIAASTAAKSPLLRRILHPFSLRREVKLDGARD